MNGGKPVMIERTPAARLLARLRVAGLAIPDYATIHPSRAGRHQLSAGAWRWFVVTKDKRPVNIGSWHTVAELLTVPRLTWTTDEYGDVTIEPFTLEQIPSGRWRLTRIEPEFVKWADDWALIGPDWTLPVGGTVWVRRFADADVVSVVVGGHLAERTVTRRPGGSIDGPTRVRYVVAAIDKGRG